MTDRAPAGAVRGRWAPPPYLLLAAAALFWSSNLVIGRAVVDEIPPIALNFWRWILALAIVLPFTATELWRHRAALVLHWRILLLLGLTGIGSFQVCVYLALQSTTAVNAALFMSAAPLMIPAVAFVLDREMLTWRRGTGLVLSLLGVVVILSRADPEVLAGLRLNRGDLWVLAAVVLWSLYSVLLRRQPLTLPPTVLLAATMAVGVGFVLPLYLWELTAVGGFAPEADRLLVIAYLAVFPAILAYFCWARGVAQVGPSRAGPFMHLVPVFSALLAMAFLGEALERHHLIGVGLIGLGLLLASRPGRVA